MSTSNMTGQSGSFGSFGNQSEAIGAVLAQNWWAVACGEFSQSYSG